MLNRLKKEIKNDLWNILNKEKISRIDFKQVIINELLGCEIINLLDVEFIAIEMEREYNFVLAYIYDAIKDIYLSDITVLVKSTSNLLCDKVKPIIQKINLMKTNGRRKLRVIHS